MRSALICFALASFSAFSRAYWFGSYVDLPDRELVKLLLLVDVPGRAIPDPVLVVRDMVFCAYGLSSWDCCTLYFCCTCVRRRLSMQQHAWHAHLFHKLALLAPVFG